MSLSTLSLRRADRGNAQRTLFHRANTLSVCGMTICRPPPSVFSNTLLRLAKSKRGKSLEALWSTTVSVCQRQRA